MMYLDGPPRVVEARVWSTMPAEFRRPGVHSEWADANRGGKPVDCFIEGPSSMRPETSIWSTFLSAASSGLHRMAPGP